MTVFAKRLPVLLIPEQLLITPVRDDVVDYGGRSQLAFLSAFCAQWMPFQEGFSFRPPAGVIFTDLLLPVKELTAVNSFSAQNSVLVSPLVAAS